MTMVRVLERGNIYFVYRPRIDRQRVEGLEEVQRFFIILQPDDEERFRRIVIGRKYLARIPEIGHGTRRTWGFVDRIGRSAEDIHKDLQEKVYATEMSGEHYQAPARSAGEGRYAIAIHDDHTHLAYALELPAKLGEVQEELNIEREGSYIVAIKNPEAPSPQGVGLAESQKAYLPGEQQERFRGRRFIPADPVRLLDHEGVEFVLIGAEEDVSAELGIELDTEHETAETAEIFNELKLHKDRFPASPLLRGKWQ